MKRVFLILAVLLPLLAFANTGSTTYYAALKTQASPTAGGLVYSGTTTTAGTYAASSTSESQSSETEGEAKTFYAFAQANDGYAFAGWSESASGTAISTANPYKVSVACSSTSSSSPTTTTLYALFSQITTVTMTYNPATSNEGVVGGGSYTVTYSGGEALSITDASETRTSDETVTLAAAPASGYKFYAWYKLDGSGNKQYFSYDATLSNYAFTASSTISAEFIPSTWAVFSIKGASSMRFYDLNEANTAATTSSSRTIVLEESGELLEGNYTISSGNTLLIPYESTYKVSKTTCEYGTDATSAALFRRLTMKAGSNVVVNGDLCVNSAGVTAGSGGTMAGRIKGAYGQILMEEGSEIAINSGASLYVWGYISGEGSVVAQSGASVYEPLQFDFRGGSHSSAVKSTCLPMNQYYVQNIEAHLTVHAGATEKLYTAAYASKMTADASTTFIGSSGLFNLQTGARLERYYDGSTDRIIYDVYGNSTLQSISVSVSVVTLDSKSVVLPITNNMTIRVQSGTTTIKYATELLADSRLEIASDATVDVQGNLFVYDRDEWVGKTCAMNSDLNPVTYAPGRKYSNASTTARTAAKMVDASILVNGILQTSGSGYFYTTSGKANVYSTGSGKIILGNGAGSKTSTPQNVSYSQTTQDIPVEPAQLRNADSTYVSTSDATSGTTYCYKSGTWWKDCLAPAASYTVVWKNEDGSVLETDTDVEEGATPSFDGATPTKEADAQYTYTFSGWSPDVVSVSADATYTAVFTPVLRKYAISWMNEASLITIDSVAYGVVPSYEGETPSKTATAEYEYSFVGWNPTPEAVSGDASYSASFSESHRHYTIVWKNYDGSTLETDTDVEYGVTPTYDGNTPEKAATAQYTYTFKEWSPAVTAVSGLAEYVALFDSTLNSYEVVFKNYDGTELQSGNVTYGVVPTAPADPTKPETAQYRYTFKAWSPAVVAVTAQAEYIATFDSIVREYTIVFKGANGETLQSGNIAYGTVPTYNGATPTKEATAAENYTFTGWSPAITEVTGEAEYVAQFSASAQEYEVVFKNYDGTELQSGNVTYGADPAYNGETPTKPATAQYRYTFKAWSPAVVAVIAQAEYIATFDSIVREYTIVFKGANGETLQSGNIAYGETPVYNGATPTKEATAAENFTFTGWSPAVVAVTGNAEYVAQFSTSAQEYEVVFKNYDGTELQSGNVTYGVEPAYNGETPTKPETAQYRYNFKAWSPAIVAVAAPAEYVATFDSIVREYTITFKSANGETLQSGNIAYGTVPTYNGATPAKEATAAENYTFTGWSPAITEVTGEAEYVALFSASAQEYEVVFQNYDGTELQKGNVTYGVEPAYNGETPTKPETAQYRYTFKAWSPAVVAVTAQAEYIATFDSIVREYTIVFKGANGETLQSGNIAYGETPVYNGLEPIKDADAANTYAFSGWSPAVVAVTGNAEYTAQFTATAIIYDLGFEAGEQEGGVITISGETTYGNTVTLTATPNEGYEFNGWGDGNTDNPRQITIGENLSLNPSFAKQRHTIAFVNYDGTPLQSGEVEHGTLPAYNGDEPAKAETAQWRYSFKGWSPAIVAATAPATYKAEFDSIVRTYTITWQDADGTVLSVNEDVAYGIEPSFDGEEPTKEADEHYTYTFAGWDSTPVAVTGDATYTATYSQTEIVPTGWSESTLSTMSVVRIAGGFTIQVSKPQMVSVYSMTGRAIYAGQVEKEHSLYLPDGVYIIRGEKDVLRTVAD